MNRRDAIRAVLAAGVTVAAVAPEEAPPSETLANLLPEASLSELDFAATVEARDEQGARLLSAPLVARYLGNAVWTAEPDEMTFRKFAGVIHSIWITTPPQIAALGVPWARADMGVSLPITVLAGDDLTILFPYQLLVLS